MVWNMTKSDLITELSHALGISRKEAAVIIDAIFMTIVGALQSGDKIEIRRFGSFHTRQRKPRTGRHPGTGARIAVPAKKMAYFTPSNELDAAINAVVNGSRPAIQEPAP